MNENIIPLPPPEHKPTLRYYRIQALCLHTGQWLHTVTGVVEIDGVAWYGEARGTGAGFTVAAFLVQNQPAYRAALGWQADITATSTVTGDGDEPPPPPAARSCRVRPVALADELALRRALCEVA